MYREFNRLPKHWQEWINMYAKDKSGGEYDTLNYRDFTGYVHLKFPDGSYAFFEYAFCVEYEERQELAVFTEHCGYHVFPLPDLQYSSYVDAPAPVLPVKKREKRKIGKVINFFDKIGVAGLDLTNGLKVGDSILIEGAKNNVELVVSSMHRDSENVVEAFAGDTVSVKVNHRVRTGDQVFLLE
ncbi:hypothetical protein ACFL2Q_05100 [Thermodesulfobacteriota bacterium]